VLKYAQESGVLSEQLNPYTGEQLSASPLTWSHAEYVETIIELLKKKKELTLI
jgi:GH15 family glucan-1,4-alpha-glucosidase